MKNTFFSSLCIYKLFIPEPTKSQNEGSERVLDLCISASASLQPTTGGQAVQIQSRQELVCCLPYVQHCSCAFQA